MIFVMMTNEKKTLLLAKEEKRGQHGKADHHAQWPKNRHYVGNAGHYSLRYPFCRREIIVPFILALFIAVILNPLVQHMVRWRVPRVLAVSILMTIIVMAMVLLLAYLGSALNELTRTLPQYRNSIMTPLQALEPLLQRIGIDVSVDQLAHSFNPNAAMTLLTNLLTQLSNAMSSIFLLLLTVLFMLLEVPQLPENFSK
ncbi:AI-2E family transporter [Escherichia coli]